MEMKIRNQLAEFSCVWYDTRLARYRDPDRTTCSSDTDGGQAAERKECGAILSRIQHRVMV